MSKSELYPKGKVSIFCSSEGIELLPGINCSVVRSSDVEVHSTVYVGHL